ncbi:MAG TPA: prepilin-type N-terminal cleavage/methylation domain-containing protein [Gaiellaceae bacterium]|jgi:prepilin-type N-terminal cleavage/methylation domain-containing protein|nr:prepilin-type N-terminal cleavage/methylation domain-containing protein [Gaiellaceae bacterium]
MSGVGPAPTSQAGFTLIEMVITMAIMSIVIGGLTTMFVQGNNAETDLNDRYLAQQTVRQAISQMRSDGHHACNAVLTGNSSVLLYYWDTSNDNESQPVPHDTCASSDINPTWSNSSCTAALCTTWCTRLVGTVYKLYRLPGASACGVSGGTQEANYLTTGNIFTYTAGVSSGTDAHDLSLLYLDVPVTLRSSKKYDKYEVTDVIVLRNSTRS